MFFDVLLPDDLRPDDRLYIQSAGAYTTAYASRFNGFDVPRTHVVGEVAAEESRPARPRLALAPSAG
jgi:ornithine decarboxylase